MASIRRNKIPFFQFLSSNGDGSGTFEATNDFTPDTNTQARVFYIQPPNHLNYEVARMLVHVSDAGNFSADNYGGLAGPLTNGIIVRKKTQASGSNASNTITDLTPDPVLNNADWGKYAYDVAYVSFGTGNNFVQVRWTFDKTGQPIFLEGGKRERLEVVLQDNFIGIDEHTFQVQGTQVYSTTSVPWSTISSNVTSNLWSNVAGPNPSSNNKILPSTPPPPLG